MIRFWQWLVTEVEFRLRRIPPTYPCVMERKLREVLGEAQYAMIRYVHPIELDCEDEDL